MLFLQRFGGILQKGLSQAIVGLGPLGSTISTRGSKYPAYGSKKLPSFILPKQKKKTSIYTHALRMRWFRLRLGKTGQRKMRPGYGRQDGILSKMNL